MGLFFVVQKKNQQKKVSEKIFSVFVRHIKYRTRDTQSTTGSNTMRKNSSVESRFIISARTQQDKNEWYYLCLEDETWTWTDKTEESTQFTDIETAVNTWNEINSSLHEWEDVIDGRSLALRKIVYHNVIPLKYGYNDMASLLSGTYEEKKDDGSNNAAENAVPEEIPVVENAEQASDTSPTPVQEAAQNTEEATAAGSGTQGDVEIQNETHEEVCDEDTACDMEGAVNAESEAEAVPASSEEHAEPVLPEEEETPEATEEDVNSEEEKTICEDSSENTDDTAIVQDIPANTEETKKDEIITEKADAVEKDATIQTSDKRTDKTVIMAKPGAPIRAKQPYEKTDKEKKQPQRDGFMGSITSFIEDSRKYAARKKRQWRRQMSGRRKGGQSH